MPSRAEIYKDYAYPVLKKFDAERIHDVSIDLLHLSESHPHLLRLMEGLACEGGQRFEDERLRVGVGGIMFENPIALAAGFDKQGRAVDSLYRLGFSSVVVGSVTQEPQPGNSKPRVFRPTNDSLLNRMGFPSEGVEAMARSLKNYPDRKYPIGVSIGLNKGVLLTEAPAAYAAVAQKLSDSADYFEINVSSPNTERLRDLQNKIYLIDVVEAVQAVSQKPLFLKVSPDLSVNQLDDVIDVSTERGLSIVATNTSINQSVKSGLGSTWSNEQGGVSGAAIEQISNHVIRHIARESDVEVIGVGGVRDLSSALLKFEAGAKSLQVYSGFVMGDGGPSFPSRLNNELIGWMDEQGVNNISELVGQSHE